MKQNAKEILEQYLKENKPTVRETPERYNILDAILLMDGRFDVDELFIKAKGMGLKTSRASIYNNINLFIDIEIIREIKVNRIVRSFFELI